MGGREKIFAFHLHKKMEDQEVETGASSTLTVRQGSWKNNDWQTLFFFLSSFPLFAGGGREVVGGAWTILKLQTELWGTAFLRPSAKMAAQCSSCGRAPPRPGCLLKTQEKAQEARHSKPPVCPEPSSAQLSPDWLGMEQHLTIRLLTHHELTSCSCGHRSAGEPSKIKAHINSFWVVCLFFCLCHTMTTFSVLARKVGWRGWGGLVGGVVIFQHISVMTMVRFEEGIKKERFLKVTFVEQRKLFRWLVNDTFWFSLKIDAYHLVHPTFPIFS